MANFKKLSRYTGGSIVINREGKSFLALRQLLNLQPGDDDIFVEVTQEIENRPDLVSNNAYGTPELWWVVYEFNNVRVPFFELKAGQLLRLPSIVRVLAAINNLES